MHDQTAAAVPVAIVIYLTMGAVTARILLGKNCLRGANWLAWLQFAARAGSIVLLWPLVLFIEKFQYWLQSVEEE